MIAIGCATSQMDYELKEGQPLASPPITKQMDRGGNNGEDEDDPWWKDKT
jgi:hypothetical protein